MVNRPQPELAWPIFTVKFFGVLIDWLWVFGATTILTLIKQIYDFD
jgi:hypothetical protein